MVKLTMIARVTDGLPLAEGLDDGRDMQDAEFYKQQVKALFKNLSRGQNEASRMSVETGPYVFHYIIEGRVCYLTMCDRAYPKKLAFQYLEDLKNEFERVNGAQIETAARPYAFIKFDTYIQKTKKLYQDTRTQRNIAKLNDELYEVHQIMTRNVQEVLGVGEKLDQVSQMSSRLTSESRIYADKARDLNRQRLAAAPSKIERRVIILMAFPRNLETDPSRFDLEELIDDNGESDDEYYSDDSECDPSYSIQKRTNSKTSRTSIRKKSKPLDALDMNLTGDSDIDDDVPNIPILNEKDEKDTLEVLSIIKAGKLEKLKVEQCKSYLRKNGLRLSGTKDVLIQRIKEHLEILNGGGEKKYPEYSFIVNCKGDACMGDIVMFEQKVYEMYNIASRSSKGPSCGTRTVAGRIVKESYGSSKQQHTFTIEVLWSKGEKPLPPLHPLLIKGRNLYRMKTMRQTWEDERERQKVLKEKHARGSLARSNREARVIEKEKRKTHKENRESRKEGYRNNPSRSNLSSAGTMLAESMAKLTVDSRNVVHQHQERPSFGNLGKATDQTKSHMFIDQNRLPSQHQHMMDNRLPFQHQHMVDNTMQNNYYSQPQTKANPPASFNIQPSIYRTNPAASSVNKVLDNRNHIPMDRMNLYPKVNHSAQEGYNQPQCRYFAVGKCYYRESCKFSHDMTEDFVQREKERLGHYYHMHQNARHCR